MSHYTQITTEYNDEDSLIQALIDIGYTRSQIEVHDQPTSLYGYHGDQREERANIIIRRQHVGGASNDVGFVKDPATGSYRAIVSEFDGSGEHSNFGKAKQRKLKARYSYHQTLKAIKKKKYKYTTTKNAQGQNVIVVQMTR